jgi:transcriptional regulator with XRE-family HTH domain
VARPNTTKKSFQEELPLLLAERGLTIRGLARDAGVHYSHLSRLMRKADYKHSPSPELLERLCDVLELPRDYFPEYREAKVLDAVRADSDLRERLYRRLRR